MSVLVLVLQVAVAQANAVPGQGSSGRTIPGGRTGTILVCYRLYAFVSFIHYCIAVLHHTSSSLATSPAGQYAMTAAESPARSLAATYSVNTSASRLGSSNSFNSLPPQARSTALFGCTMFGPFRMCLTPVAQQQPVRERQSPLPVTHASSPARRNGTHYQHLLGVAIRDVVTNSQHERKRIQ
jgi:hypothetical protein